MLGALIDLIYVLPAGLFYVALLVVMLAIAGMIKDWLTPYSVTEQLVHKDNPALGLSLTGYYIGVIIVFIGALYDPDANMGADEMVSMEFLKQVLSVFGYAFGGIIFLNLARFIADKMILNRFSTHKEIIEDRNIGTGAAEFGNYIASALIIAGAFSGKVLLANGDEAPWWHGILTSLAFFFMAQLVFIIYGKFYQWITRYDIHDEIEKDNVPAGVALGGNLIAIGVILCKSVAGDFIGWAENGAVFILWSVLGFAIMYIIRLLVDFFLLPESTISEEIARDRNINAAFLETGILIGVAATIFFAL